MMPFNSPSEASLRALFTSSAEAATLSSQTRSTIETVGVGTLIDIPLSFPSNSGITTPIAFAAPVDVGIRFNAPARALLMSLCDVSMILWSFVYEWIVVINPLMMPNFSLITFATGARQFVVQDAFEISLSFSASKVFSFTPRTIVRSKSLPGAETRTLFAPALRCFSVPARSRNTPVDSITVSIPSFPHGRFSGSRSPVTTTSLPLTMSLPSPTSTSAFRGP